MIKSWYTAFFGGGWKFEQKKLLNSIIIIINYEMYL